jgi:DNA replication protein DnaC
MREWLSNLTPISDESLLADEEPTEECAVCGGLGLLARRRGPRLTEYVECQACRLLSKRRIAKVFRRADIPKRFSAATFASYPGARANGVSDVEAWANGTGQQSLVLYGEAGRGKTSLAVASMKLRVERDQCDALFITTPKLLDRIRETYSGRSEDAEAEVLHLVETVGLLVLDDLGAERVTDWVREKLFTILNARHDALLPTIYTSNLGPEELAGHIGGRTAERLKEDCAWVELVGPNLRERED